MPTRIQNPENYNFYIYLITNLINNKKYIGKRSCKCKIEEDWYWGSGTILKAARKKYGLENFKKEILEVCDTEDEVLEKEIYYIKLYDACNSPDFYNLTKGGEGTAGRILEQESVEKLKNSNPNKKKCYCHTTKEFFNSLNEACRKYNIQRNCLHQCLKGVILSAGKHPTTGEKLQWGYVLEDGTITTNCFRERMSYSETHREKIEECNKKFRKKVVLIETGEIFDSMKEASILKNTCYCSIGANCAGKIKYTTNRETKEIFHWKFLIEEEGK